MGCSVAARTTAAGYLSAGWDSGRSANFCSGTVTGFSSIGFADKSTVAMVAAYHSAGNKVKIMSGLVSSSFNH